MKKIDLFPLIGSFGENKDVARTIRLEQIMPALEKAEEVVLNFEDVETITQSFCHALISDVLRNYGIDVLDRVSFSNCSEEVKAIIEIVSEYMQ
jgi:hypothetical protein